MAGKNKFLLGSPQSLGRNIDYAEFKKILDEIHSSQSTRFKEGSDGNMYFHLKQNVNTNKPYFYVDDTDNKFKLTHLKYGIPGGESDCLAIYDSGILAESDLILLLDELKKVQQSLSESTVSSSNSSNSRGQEESNSNNGANFQFDFSFFCLCSTVGGFVLLLGAMIANPVVLTVGACMMGAGAVGMGYNHFFNPAAARDINPSTQDSNRFGRVDF